MDPVFARQSYIIQEVSLWCLVTYVFTGTFKTSSLSVYRKANMLNFYATPFRVYIHNPDPRATSRPRYTGLSDRYVTKFSWAYLSRVWFRRVYPTQCSCVTRETKLNISQQKMLFVLQPLLFGLTKLIFNFAQITGFN